MQSSDEGPPISSGLSVVGRPIDHGGLCFSRRSMVTSLTPSNGSSGSRLTYPSRFQRLPDLRLSEARTGIADVIEELGTVNVVVSRGVFGTLRVRPRRFHGGVTTGPIRRAERQRGRPS